MCINPVWIKRDGRFVPCGKCPECLMQRSNEWAFRCALEASLYDKNCIITLTYNEANLPQGGTLVKRDMQLFLKRLRKHLRQARIRFFGCGEYGKKFDRPHYHIILFNHDFDDKYFFFVDKKGQKQFRSPMLEKLWNKGFSTVGEMSFESAKYCAKYLQKIPPSYFDKLKPFLLMSRRPGIGAGALKDSWLITDKVFVNGKYIKVPRFFLSMFERQGFELSEFKLKREKRFNSDYVDEQGQFCSDLFLFDSYVRRERLVKLFGQDFFDNFQKNSAKPLDELQHMCYYGKDRETMRKRHLILRESDESDDKSEI